MGTGTVCGRSVVEFSRGIGAPGEIRTPDPQIRSLGSTIEIIEVRSHKRAGLDTLGANAYRHDVELLLNRREFQTRG